ncbi:hypothetical protein [Stieleria varia]|uniref:Uncharacterized protein n=1 Tax=Stieleria varia TaxID=2528005 RepID=A0A5C6AG58_9BACT|nr:hypothetical protein [Stieleria varia]TWT98298.1 hypothetical protein Pla52n_48090 [Stieleria varia]
MAQPKLDEDLLQRLAALAARLDGGDENADASILAEFNQLAGTSIPFSEFQGIYGAEEHIDYVRRVLTDRVTEALPGLERDTLATMFAKVLADPCDNAYLQYVFTTIKKTFGDNQISDLVFWPGEYFGDGDNQRELTPELMADAVLERYAKRQSR